MSRSFNFTIGNEDFLVNEVANIAVNRRRVTEIEIRKDCGDYYRQFRSGHVPRNADEAVIRQYIADYYAVGEWDYEAA
jgi:hypothetical protein